MINAVVVGLGWWGRHFVTALAESKRLRVTGLAARSPDKHRDFAETHKLPLYESFESVLRDRTVDAVILCTPNSQHEGQVLAAFEAGKEVFCEKPLALSRAAAERMVEAAARDRRVLGVGHERRFEPPMEEIARHVSQGELGTVLHAEANWSHDLLVGLDPASWRVSPAEGPSIGMTGMGVHLTDLMLAMLGPIEAVCASRANRLLGFPTGDVTALQLRFRSGATGTLATTVATPYYCRYTVFGARMWAEARDSGHPQHGGETFLTTCGKDGVQQSHSFEARDTALANLEEWAAAIEGAGRYRFSAEELVGNVALLEAIGRSAEDGGAWVRL